MAASVSATLFDTFGVRIPYDGLINDVTSPNWNYYIDLPALNHDAYAARWRRFKQFLPASELPNWEQFWQQANDQQIKLSEHPALRDLLQGPCLPLVIPAGIIQDFGTYLAEMILPAVEASCKTEHPDQKYINHMRYLAGQVDVVWGSNHGFLALAMEEGPATALYFPDALRGWSINACREQMETLPRDVTIVLPDAMIHGLGIIGYPDVLAHSQLNPRLVCAANTWQAPRSSMSFEVQGDELIFGGTGSLSRAYGNATAGLLVLG
jgi:hypothetical protein